MDAESRKARDTLGGKVSFRMSRSAWNEMILPEGDDISLSATYSNQPVYDKYRLSAMLDGPHERRGGLIANLDPHALRYPATRLLGGQCQRQR